MMKLFDEISMKWFFGFRFRQINKHKLKRPFHDADEVKGDRKSKQMWLSFGVVEQMNKHTNDKRVIGTWTASHIRVKWWKC